MIKPKIPEAAYFAAQKANKYEWSRESIKAAAPFIIIAELRRLIKSSSQSTVSISALLDRIAELEQITSKQRN